MRERSHVLHELLDRPVRVYVMAAGAGAGIQNYLWNVPGASQFLVGASFPYAKEDLTRLIGYEPEKFVCQRTAMDMAISAYLLANNGDASTTPIGLGMTASVASLKAHRGEHRVCCAAVSRTEAWYAEVVLDKGVGEEARRGDGSFADVMGLEVLLHAAKIKCKIPAWNATEIVGAMEEAREAFFARSLFTRDGRRLPASEATGRTLFPGAFNPPHKGHFYAGGSDVVFQVTSNPPKDVNQEQHKPSLTLGEMLDRCHWVSGLRDILFLEDGATYLDKARLYPGSTLVIGSDVVARILDPKWGHDPAAALAEFASLNTKFEVGQKGSTTVKEALSLVPEPYVGLFSELPANPYSDLNSRDIRSAKNPAG